MRSSDTSKWDPCFPCSNYPFDHVNRVSTVQFRVIALIPEGPQTRIAGGLLATGTCASARQRGIQDLLQTLTDLASTARPSRDRVEDD